MSTVQTTSLLMTGFAAGLPDSTQYDRILSVPGSRLLVADYHPWTASQHAINCEPITSLPRRVVIEILPEGPVVWRPMPLASGASSIDDEGSWPRVVDFCGSLKLCTLEQWEFHKLDPMYDCSIRDGSWPSILANAGYVEQQVHEDEDPVEMDIDNATTELLVSQGDNDLVRKRSESDVGQASSKKSRTDPLGAKPSFPTVSKIRQRLQRAAKPVDVAPLEEQFGNTSIDPLPTTHDEGSSDELEDQIMVTAAPSLVPTEHEEQEQAKVKAQEVLDFRQAFCAHVAASPWNNKIAIENQQKLLKRFEAGINRAEHMLTPLSVPWPILERTVTKVTSEKVNTFLITARYQYGDSEFAPFVQCCLNCFAPDKWVQKLEAVEADKDRQQLEEGRNIVYEALLSFASKEFST